MDRTAVLCLLGAFGDGPQWNVRCPAHEDQHASLSIRIGDKGGIVVKCHAGCSEEDIAQSVGLKRTDFFPPSENGKAKPEVVATYEYRDEERKILYQVVRFEPKDFRPSRPDGLGWWKSGLGNVRRVVYHLPDLCEDAAIFWFQ